jgi:hypothetical protein
VTGTQHGYVYGASVILRGQPRTLEGTAVSPAPCSEERLRAVVVRDLSRDEGVPVGDIEIVSFHYSEMAIPLDVPGTTGQRDT